MRVIDVPVQHILELSCSAYRTIGPYIKEHDFYDENNEVPNKLRILSTLNLIEWKNRYPPKHLVIKDPDIELANNIRSFYKRLAFNVVADENPHVFESTIFSLLNTELMKSNDTGYLAYLPYKYKKEYSQNALKKYSTICDNDFLGSTGLKLFDLDSEIVEVYKSKNYDAYNITAVIDNKMCSWMTKHQLTVGPAVIVHATIKEHSVHYKYGNKITRLHFVKAAQ